MDLHEEEINCLKELIGLSPETLQNLLKNIENDNFEGNQKYYEILIKLSIIQRKSNFENYFSSYIYRMLKGQNLDEQIKMIIEFINRKHDVYLNDKKKFIDLSWRLESKIGSRSVRETSIARPKIVIELYRTEYDSPDYKNAHITTSLPTLKHLINKLEQAIIDSKINVRK